MQYKKSGKINGILNYQHFQVLLKVVHQTLTAKRLLLSMVDKNKNCNNKSVGDKQNVT